MLISASAFSLVYVGQYLALEGQFGNLSPVENIANLLVFPLITVFWTIIFILNVSFAMIMALSQKFIERLEKVPEKDVNGWIFDNLTLFNTFAPKMNQYCLVVMSGL